MTTIELKLHPAAAKILDYYHDRVPGIQPELTGIFRRLVLMMVEPLWDDEMKAYRTGQFYHDLTQTINVKIAERIARDQIDNRKAVWVPPHKMKLISDFMIEIFEKEINDVVDCAIENGKEINASIKSVFDKYDIDDEEDYKMETAIKMNQRYRKKMEISPDLKV